MNLFIIFGAKYLILIVVAIAAGYFWFLFQKEKLKKQTIVFAFLTLVIAYLLAKLAGYFYVDPRPFVAEHIVPLIPHAPDNGFPSDHTLLASALGVILYPYHKKLSILVLVLALLVGVSRVAAGVHHPIDVVGSFACAIIAAYIADRIAKKL